jgi:hypothetical protein
MPKRPDYCCKEFVASLDGYNGGVHFMDGAAGEGYYVVLEHRSGRYSEYTAWDDYEYSKVPFKFCPFCGSNTPGAR